MKRKLYETPQVETLEVSAEGIFCLSDPTTELEKMGYEELDW